MMLEAPGAATAAFLAGVVLPVAMGMVLDASGQSVWDGLALYKRLDEYGERKRWAQPVRTLLNSYTSLAFWAVGVGILVDCATRVDVVRNCASAAPHFNIALGVACVWTGVASFAFHASLSEVWRILDAGATMGVPFLPASSSLHRLALSLGVGASPAPFVAAGIAGNIGCHFLARTQGWSDIVLPACILSNIAVDFGLLAAYRTRSDVNVLACFAACAIVGILLRVADIKLHRRMRLVWLGHSCWHLLMSAAILIAYQGSLTYDEPFCA